MKFTSSLLAAAASVATVAAKKVFIDNDGLNGLQLLIPLYGGYEIVGLSMSFGSSSSADSLGTAYDVLTTYNMTSCIPLYLGAQQPLIQTNDTFHLHNTLFGAPVWQGAFTPGYVDSYDINNITYNDTPGALALIDAVKKYKDTDPVMIWAAGMMTTVAQAISIYPKLVEEAAGLYIMGGYVDTQMAQATGNAFQVDVNTDINLIQDPEAAQIVLTAGWKELYIGGNVTNYLVPSQELYDRIIEKAGGLDVLNNNTYFSELQSIVVSGNYTENAADTENILPFWDEVVSAFMAFPDIITSSTPVLASVDTSFYSPFYGQLRIWGADFAPTAGYKTGNATIVNSIKDAVFYDFILSVLFEDWRQFCDTGKYSCLKGKLNGY
ncbi:inosine-uridine preferring nucleoside hydrolase [Ophiostoma piceae UAMH 11346]|uniref:Inosine-uridine preferring nucleoside hydrolase n=1 Tax=Ophiostoma piceae (strain UAMH 11346) TaxID=1262450 RepID=S3C654_OPHP1|nr:inosine-uridine preferring nucleoside hydrolase [Ophiostoma piceae UAMH 11346]